MPVAVRSAQPPDAEAVAALARELRQHVGDSLDHLTPERIVADGFGEVSEFTVLVAELDGSAVGYALFHDAYEPAFAAKGAYLCDLYVRSAARRTGVGRALVGAVIAETSGRNRRYVWWNSQHRNREAHAFYARLGAVEHPVVAHVLVLDDAPVSRASP